MTTEFDSSVRWVVPAVALMSLALVSAAGLVTPARMAEWFSPDGSLHPVTHARIQVLRVMAAFGAVTAAAGGFLVARMKSHDVRQWARALVRAPLDQPDRVSHALMAGVLSLVTILHVSDVLVSWPQVRGAEYWNIARSVAAGHGFSLNDSDRWFWVDFERQESDYDLDRYFPTAIEEPIYPIVLGNALRVLGDRGALVMLLLQLSAWVGTCLFVYLLGRRAFGAVTGLLAGLAMTAWPAATFVAIGYLGPAPFGALIVTAIGYLTLAAQGPWTFRQDAALGAFLGLATLTLAAMQVYIPLVAACVLWFRGLGRFDSWLRAGAIVVVAALVIAPWTIRNWQLFDEFVPVRTGAGLIAHQGNPILASSFHPNLQACSRELGPMPWSAAGPREAILGLKHARDKEMAIYKRSYDCIALEAPEGYENFNEAQRDKLYLSRATEFTKAEPRLFVEMAALKYLSLLIGWSTTQTVVALLAVLGGLVALRHTEGRIVVVILAAFIGPYAIGVPWGYRYRYPIEPLLLLLACHFVAWIIGHARK